MHKVSIANNTLNFNIIDTNYDENILDKFKITTTKNVIFVGRIEKRKKIENLISAFKKIDKSIGLIIVGEDKSNIIPYKLPENIYYLGSLYGEKIQSLLNASDIFCLPGHVGLSIVDAFYHSLPLITENGKHAPEISYLKNKYNGFIVEENNIKELSDKINYLLENKYKLKEMGGNAKSTIMQDGSIENMFAVFLNVCKSRSSNERIYRTL